MKSFRIHGYRAARFTTRSNQFAGTRPVEHAFSVVTEQHRSCFPHCALKGRSQFREDAVVNARRRFRVRPKQLLTMRDEASFCRSRPPWVANQRQAQPVELTAKRFYLFRGLVITDYGQELNFSAEC